MKAHLLVVLMSQLPLTLQQTQVHTQPCQPVAAKVIKQCGMVLLHCRTLTNRTAGLFLNRHQSYQAPAHPFTKVPKALQLHKAAKLHDPGNLAPVNRSQLRLRRQLLLLMLLSLHSCIRGRGTREVACCCCRRIPATSCCCCCCFTWPGLTYAPTSAPAAAAAPAAPPARAPAVTPVTSTPAGDTTRTWPPLIRLSEIQSRCWTPAKQNQLNKTSTFAVLCDGSHGKRPFLCQSLPA